MARVPTLFFDVGGVLLTNAWDTAARQRAAAAFGLDYPEFQTRHEMLKTAFETGRLSHAELRGQYALEHSFFVAPESLVLPAESPLARQRWPRCCANSAAT